MALLNAIFKDVRANIDCPECDAEAGSNCEDINAVHQARLDAYIESKGGLNAFRELIRNTAPQRR